MSSLDQPPLNPYAAPQAELHSAELPVAWGVPPPRNPAGNTGTIVSVWVILFFLNLPLPVYLGLMCSNQFSALGMVPPIVGYLALTIWWIRTAGRFAGCWIAGSLCVAASQFLPYLHFVLGAMAVGMFNGLQRGMQGGLNFFGAFCCTIIVGGGLIAVSLALAGVFYLIFVSWKES